MPIDETENLPLALLLGCRWRPSKPEPPTPERLAEQAARDAAYLRRQLEGELRQALADERNARARAARLRSTLEQLPQTENPRHE